MHLTIFVFVVVQGSGEDSGYFCSVIYQFIGVDIDAKDNIYSCLICNHLAVQLLNENAICQKLSYTCQWRWLSESMDNQVS